MTELRWAGPTSKPTIGAYKQRWADETEWVATNGERPPYSRAQEAEWLAENADPDTIAHLQQHGELSPEPTSWEPVNLAPILTAITTGATSRPTPTLLTRADGTGLWYPARINGIFGDSGSGKSWLAMWGAAQQILQNSHVIWIDFEDQADSVTIRMLDLGLTPELINSHFHYIAPDLGFTTVTAAPLLQLIDTVQPTLVTIDSTGEAMAVQGTKDKDDEVAAWFRLFPRRLARTGAAVAVIDHVTKDPDTRGLYAIGSQRKRAAIDGAAYLVEAVRQFGQHHAGMAKITTAKDRNGTHIQGTVAAQFHLDATNPTPYLVTLRDPDGRSDRPFRPTALMEKISRLLEINPQGMTKTAVETTIRGKHDYKRLALELLVTEGYVSLLKAGPGGGVPHVSMNPFREQDDPHFAPSPPPRPTSPRAGCIHLAPSPPTPKGGEVARATPDTPKPGHPATHFAPDQPATYHDPDEAF